MLHHSQRLVFDFRGRATAAIALDSHTSIFGARVPEARFGLFAQGILCRRAVTGAV